MSDLPSRYAPMDSFAAPARPSAETGRLIVSVLLIEIFYAGLRELTSLSLERIDPEWAWSYETGQTASGLLAQLSSFSLLILALVFVLHRRHDRGFLSLTGPVRPALAQFARVMPLALAALLLVELLPPWWDADTLAETRALPVWLGLLPLAVGAMLVQTGAEELFYRGFIQQQLAARHRSAWVWLCLPSLLFAIAHWENGATLPERVQYVIWAFCFGLAAGDLTARAGNIGPALAFHMANNAYAFLLYGTVGYPDTGLALWLFSEAPQPGGPGDMPPGEPLLSLGLLRDLLLIALLWLTARLAMRR